MKDAEDPRFGKAAAGHGGGAGGGAPAQAQGCVCPPGANLACENPQCPRKPGTGGVKAFEPGAGGDLMMKGGR